MQVPQRWSDENPLSCSAPPHTNRHFGSCYHGLPVDTKTHSCTLRLEDRRAGSLSSSSCCPRSQLRTSGGADALEGTSLVGRFTTARRALLALRQRVLAISSLNEVRKETSSHDLLCSSVNCADASSYFHVSANHKNRRSILRS